MTDRVFRTIVVVALGVIIMLLVYGVFIQPYR